MLPPEFKDTKFMLDEDLARQAGLVCMDCKSRQVVYAITNPYPPAFPAGAYCYKHLLSRCYYSHMIPFPIETNLLDKLQADLGLTKDKKFIIIVPEPKSKKIGKERENGIQMPP